MMKKLRLKLSTIFMILLAVLLIPGIANAKTNKEYQGNLWNFKKTIKVSSGAFTYYAYPSKNQKEAWIYKIKIRGGKDCSKLSIPSKLDHKKVTRLGSREREFLKTDEDELYNIFGIGAEPWHNDHGGTTKRIQKLILPNTVKVIQPVSFSGMDSIKTVKIPKNVKTLGEYTFYGCNNLETINLPVNLKSLNALAFIDCPKLTEIKLSSKNKTYQVKERCVITKKKKELVYALTGEQIFQIPEGVKVIKKYAFGNCDFAVSRIHIPASVEKIEECAFMNPHQYADTKSTIKNITVDEANSVYAKDGQCIYNKIDKSLSVAIPDEKRVLYISEQVEKLTEEYSVVGINLWDNSLEKVVYPKTLKTVEGLGFHLLHASKTYFTGENPPTMKKVNKYKHNSKLPVFTEVYVPDASSGIYKDWYEKYDCFDVVNSWHTYKPEDEI